ncbi:MAG: hypothetical protein EKK64_10255 [Neisseriaceae bacterium]|nr:MAG: hypothetical protein EKK64_10255 [Neisseriaceae bacterium]
MKIILKYEEFVKSKIAQDDDDNIHQESGYLVIEKDSMYSFFKYSHCSCFDTWDCIKMKSEIYKEDAKESWNNLYVLSPLWIGNRQDLDKMVRFRLDPNFPDRKADPEDFDYDHLMNVYNQLEVYLFENKE